MHASEEILSQCLESNLSLSTILSSDVPYGNAREKMIENRNVDTVVQFMVNQNHVHDEQPEIKNKTFLSPRSFLFFLFFFFFFFFFFTRN